MENNVVYCHNCGSAINVGDAFCQNCGAQQTVVQQENVQPAYEVVQQDVVAETQAAPKVSVKSKVFGGIGFGLSLFGFIFAIIFFLLTIGINHFAMYSIMLVYSIVFLPFSIVGLAFCSGSRKDGNLSGLTGSGKAFGIIGIILYALCFVISLGGLLMY